MNRSATPLPSGSRTKEASFDAQTLDFILKVAGHVVGAVIMTQFQSTRHAGHDGPKQR